jgi:hypothetical protein
MAGGAWGSIRHPIIWQWGPYRAGVIRGLKNIAGWAGQNFAAGGQGNSLLLELSMPCEVRDNCFEDPRIMTWLKTLA